MIGLGNGDLVRAAATNATQVNYFIENARDILASGQVAASEGTLYTADRSELVQARFYNTGGGNNTVDVYIQPSGGTSRIIHKIVLASTESAVVGPDGMKVYDANGNLKQGPAGSFSATTLTGALTLNDGVALRFGTDLDYSIDWDGTNLDILLLTDDTILRLGNGTASSDIIVYGNSASLGFSWDASASDLKLEDSSSLMFGTGAGAFQTGAGDVEIRWDATDLDMLAAADDTVFKIGNGTNSFDIWAYGNTASDYLLWDASASTLTAVGAADMRPLGRVITDPGNAGAIPVVGSGYCPIVTAGAETRTLAAPSYAGQMLLLSMKTDGGDAVITCSTTLNETGNNTITFADTGDSIMLFAVEEGANLRWRCPVSDGHSLTTV